MKIQKTLLSNLGSAASDKFSASLLEYHKGIQQTWHSHNEFILAMSLRGNVREQVKCEDILVREFDVGIKSPDVRHTDHFCPKGVRVIRLSLTPDFAKELKKQALLNDGWYWQKGSSAIRCFLRIGQSLLAENLQIEDDVHELLAALLTPKTYAPETAPLWLKRAKTQLDDTFSEGTRLSQLSQETQVHPVYFARRFKEFYGCSVGTYIRQLQFQKVQNLMVSGKRNLAQIAVEAGFSDQSHLTRIFNDEFGITPAKFRKLLS